MQLPPSWHRSFWNWLLKKHRAEEPPPLPAPFRCYHGTPVTAVRPAGTRLFPSGPPPPTSASPPFGLTTAPRRRTCCRRWGAAAPQRASVPDPLGAAGSSAALRRSTPSPYATSLPRPGPLRGLAHPPHSRQGPAAPPRLLTCCRCPSLQAAPRAPARPQLCASRRACAGPSPA